ncbi:Crp/Fnr family transcriptional regulator [Bacillus timonensis]|nr:Crp/Fnr family transcriptional regulator [Bacillus timonensis]
MLDEPRILLRESPMFNELNLIDFDHLLKKISIHYYEKNVYLFKYGEPLTTIYFIARGKAKLVQLDGNGKDKTIKYLLENEVYPLNHFYMDNKHSYTAIALETTLVIHIPIYFFEQLLAKYPLINVYLIKSIQHEILSIHNQLNCEFTKRE